MATVLRAAARRSVGARSQFSASVVAKRCLGDSVAGPAITDVAANARFAKEFFTKHAQSYAEYKQQCMSLRMFAFAGVTAGCGLALMIDPPKSSYWVRFGPTYWFSHIRELFSSSTSPLFLREKAQHSLDVSSLVGLPADEMKAKAAVPKVVFVLGGPGAGKGTQCGLVVERFKDWAHISAGDCLRAERNDPSSKVGELINNYIKEGKIVPVEITVKLLQKAMAAERGKTCFLIDGFPRNLDNVTGWENVVGNAAQVCGVLFYEADEKQLEKRLMKRGETSGRADDNIESIRKRFKTYINESMPIVERYKKDGLVTSIDGMPAPENVWKVTEAAIRSFEAM